LRTWKKALSAGVTAMLLASLTVSSAFAVKGATGDSDQTDWLTCAVANVHTVVKCSQVADGISSVTLAGDVTGVTGAAGGSLYITATGASIVGVAGGKFTLAAGVVTTGALGIAAHLAVTDTITLRAPSAAGTSVVSVYLVDGGTGLAGTPETLTITWTATSGLGVSTANSVVKTVTGACALNGTLDGFTNTALSSAPASPTATDVAHLCILVRDGNGSPITTAAGGVGATITPVGLLNGLSIGQTTTATTGANGVADIAIRTTGIAGTGTIAVNVTVGTVTTTFAPMTFTFTGAIAKIVLTINPSVFLIDSDFDCNQGTGGTWTQSQCPGQFTATDAAGNKVATTDATYIVSSPAVTTQQPVNGAAVGANDDDQAMFNGAKYVPGYFDVVCNTTAGTETVAIKAGGITSNAVTLTCSDVPDTYTVAWDKTTVAPGGTATLTVSAKDANGLPASGIDYDPISFDVHTLVSSGAITANSAQLVNGMATFTFLAPFNTGVATALATVDGIAGSKTASIAIGTPVPLASSCSVASALGANATSGFSTSAKTAGLGKYITFKVTCAASSAGSTVGILVSTKSGGAYSAYTRLTGRVVDSSGVAIFNWKSATSASIGVRADAGGSLTNWVFANWR
jgi:hypothetical protein